jgi:hypothetical protein
MFFNTDGFSVAGESCYIPHVNMKTFLKAYSFGKRLKLSVKRKFSIPITKESKWHCRPRGEVIEVP